MTFYLVVDDVVIGSYETLERALAESRDYLSHATNDQVVAVYDLYGFCYATVKTVAGKE